MTKRWKKCTREFCGREDSEIDTDFMEWHQKMAGSVRNVKRQAIEDLPRRMLPPKPGKVTHQNTRRMIVEYEGLIDTTGKAAAGSKKRKRPLAHK
jgi:hypothetical protein